MNRPKIVHVAKALPKYHKETADIIPLVNSGYRVRKSAL